ncbi:putative transcription factor interactor and regulator CCHC(Zn) family [Helianthus annuus]|uniref:Transcription factor interactor and regulator CCHC(Zn) family n=1 Tax=Helianthus annuus TaxID=4232 RepID=A0A9K3JE22_HELAN|nr:putative transcription factor interactor and regulator CCHC(Zn) family [Helianthus annuus]
MTKEDYNHIDPEEMKLTDIRWCMAGVVRRAQQFMEISVRNSIEGPDSKLGFDKSKVTCFRCKEKGHFKRECINREVNENINMFGSDYYKKAIHHRNSQHPLTISRPIPIEDGSKSKDKALVVMQEDEGFNWNSLIPKTDGLALMAELVELGESEKVEKTADELHAEINFDEYSENSVEAKSTILDTEQFQILRKEVINNAFRSVLPPDVFQSLAGFFGEKVNYDDLHFSDDEKEPLEEIISGKK